MRRGLQQLRRSLPLEEAAAAVTAVRSTKGGLYRYWNRNYLMSLFFSCGDEPSLTQGQDSDILITEM